MAEKRVYTVQELVEMLGTTRQYIYQLINSGCFRAVKAGKRYVIIKSSFDEWLDGKSEDV